MSSGHIKMQWHILAGLECCPSAKSDNERMRGAVEVHAGFGSKGFYKVDPGIGCRGNLLGASGTTNVFWAQSQKDLFADIRLKRACVVPRDRQDKRICLVRTNFFDKR